MPENKNIWWALIKPYGVGAFVAAVFGVGVWVANNDGRLASLEDTMRRHLSLEAHPDTAKRITRLEVQQDGVKEDLAEIKAMLRDIDKRMRARGQ